MLPISEGPIVMKKKLSSLIIICTVLSGSVLAEQLEVSAMFGQMYSSDLTAASGSNIDVDSASNIAIGIAWQESVNGQGQILLNRVNHNFSNENNVNNSLNIVYAHFNGVALFRQQNYVTTMSLGVGGAYVDAKAGNKELYPSVSIAFGTRYELSNNIAMVTELRAYATLIDKDDAIFCQQESCSANFDNSLWMDSSITVGIAIKY